MKNLIVNIVLMTGMVIWSFWLFSSAIKFNSINFINLLEDNHDLIVGIPGITKSESEELIKSLESVNGIKKVKFCYNMDCILIIKDIKNPPSDSSLLLRIQNALPGKQTYIKEYTTIEEFEQQCNFIKK